MGEKRELERWIAIERESRESASSSFLFSTKKKKMKTTNPKVE
jgi:hypothetical protein